MSALSYTDALAYYDCDIDLKHGVRAAVEQEIEAEKKNIQPRDYLPPEHVPFSQEAMAAVEQREADEITEETDRLNRARRDAQLRVGERLTMLQNRWAALVSKNLSLSAANITAHADIDVLNARKLELEAELVRLDANGP
ncbi:hypothetical protein MCUN1_001075 [Malassezia cuniculi]|uniref:Pre-mRNA-splicing factor SPF27 n=1 Tax=Malassezia cuniculi TaxID=948313 RepID=A0AAF0EX21_9BASI|nr:hypothetical protein MCUN1_001075 [Malassezia cuniculi]